MSEFEAGTILLGRFRIDRRLARGGMALVLEGTDLDEGGAVAIKVLPQRMDEDAHRARFLREARLAMRVVHPNVVKTIAVGFEEDSPFIIMRKIEGITLREHLNKRGAMRVEDAVHCLRGVLEGVEACHQAGVIHRDLTPSNILLTPLGPRVIDFGLGKNMMSAGLDTSITKPHEALGTPYYMSPEQIMAEPVDQTTDLYSLGLVFYEMLCGERAFPSEGRERADRVLDRVLTHHCPPLGSAAIKTPRALFPALDTFIARATVKRPSARFKSAAAMAQAIPSC